MQNSLPESFGRFEVKSKIGRGGMGTVYKAYDPMLKRLVALKVLKQDESTDDETRTRFQHEILTVANLEHAAIVPIYENGEDNDQLYFVMRWMKGGTLVDHLKENTLTLSEIAKIITRLASALDTTHSQKIIHRDLKPANILFDEDDKAYLSDFGIAKMTQSNADLTGSRFIGTPAYTSPEQLQGNRKIDWRADIYMLGIILFEMLTGRSPYPDDTPHRAIKGHLFDPIPSIYEFRDDVPFECEAVVKKAMAKLPEDRFESAGEMAAALISAIESNNGAVASTYSSDNVVSNAQEQLSSENFFVKRWPWLLLIAVIIGIPIALLSGFPGRLTTSSVATITSPSIFANLQTATPEFTFTATPTPPPVIEGSIVFIFYDSASAIVQIGDGGIERVPENGQLPIPVSGEPILLQSNTGSMELLLPDKTRLFISQNTTLKIERVSTVNEAEQTEITLDAGLIVVSNQTEAVSLVGPLDVHAEMNIGIMEVNQDSQQVDIDCIEGICPLAVAGESDLVLQTGEATFVRGSGEVADVGGARYELYNNIISGLFITPTPLPTATPSPVVIITPEPTLSWPETTILGQSVNEQPIEAVRFGDGPVNLIFIGGLHAGFAPSTATLADEMISYFEDHLDEIPTSVTLYIVPSANPDSVISPGEKEGRYNANGVDLNRNWDCLHVEDPLIGGELEPGRGGAEPFSEPETVALRDFIVETGPTAVIFWMARSAEGLISPGACESRNPASDELGAIYSAVSDYAYVPDIEGTIGFTLNGDASNWLDKQGYATVSVLLRDYLEIDFQRNLAGVRAVLNQYQTDFLPGLQYLQAGAPDEIVFQSNRDGDFEIYIMNVDGTNQRQLTFNDDADRFPRVSANGLQIVFESERDGNKEIYVMNRDGSDPRRLTDNPTSDRLPSWSPDGQQIIFHSFSNSGETDLFIMNVDGTESHPITVTNAIESHAGWSITNRIVYHAKEDDQSYWQIYTSNVSGRNQQQLTETRADNWSPEWSPNGQLIVFLSERVSSANSGIYVMNVDGNEAELIFNSTLLEWGPSWSADGSQIVFTMDQEDNTADIFIMNADGTDAQRIIERGGYPSWAVAIRATSPSVVNSIATPVTAPTSIPSSGSCLTNALVRWRDNLYSEFADRLGCVQSPELYPTAVYQLYEHGLMVWRKDNNSIYVLYYAESYETHSITLPDGTDFYVNERTKGAIGYLWANQAHIESQLGEPLDTEMGASEFTLQEFADGTMFYFKENRGNSYILMADQNELRIVQEK